MRVTLDVNDDAELRNHIKDVIRGQVESIVREQTKESLVNIMTMKYKDADTIIEKMISEKLDSILQEKAREWGHPTIKDAVHRQLETRIQQEIKAMVNERLKGMSLTL